MGFELIIKSYKDERCFFCKNNKKKDKSDICHFFWVFSLRFLLFSVVWARTFKYSEAAQIRLPRLRFYVSL